MSSRKPLQEIVAGFTSREEEAAFWDSVDLGDYEEDLGQVELDVAPDSRHRISVRFDGDAWRRLNAVARTRGVTVAALVQSWTIASLTDAERAGEAGQGSSPARASAD